MRHTFGNRAVVIVLAEPCFGFAVLETTTVGLGRWLGGPPRSVDGGCGTRAAVVAGSSPPTPACGRPLNGCESGNGRRGFPTGLVGKLSGNAVLRVCANS